MKDPFEMKDRTGGMRVPTGYFEAFHQRMEDEVGNAVLLSASGHTSKRISPWIKRAMYVAAMLIGVLWVYKQEGRKMTDEENVFREFAFTEEEMLSSSVTEYDLYEYLYVENE